MTCILCVCARLLHNFGLYAQSGVFSEKPKLMAECRKWGGERRANFAFLPPVNFPKHHGKQFPLT